MTHWILYGMPGSLYTAKARSYLRKQGLPLEERAPGDRRFTTEIVPVTGRWIIPVLQTPSGEIVQDGTDIIDHVEQTGLATRSAYPTEPVAKVVSLIFELFGGEGLLRPAMHYRWNFDGDNLPFLERDFVNALFPGADAETRAGVFARSSGLMRKAAAGFGVTPDSFAQVEASYLDLLDRLDAHFAVYPYLLGDSPTIGDYGLIAPLHAHLSRDPHPSMLMKQRALHVWRWVERMTTRDDDAPEFLAQSPPVGTALSSPTLAALLAFVAEDYLPEVDAMVGWLNAWLPEQPADRLAGPMDRSVGRMTFPWRGLDLTVMVMPYRIWLLQRVQDAADGLAPTERQALEALLAPAGLSGLLTARVARRVVRRDQREWWAA
jgi:glutathione S-transferase